MAMLQWGAATNEGTVRDENEDTFVAEEMVFVVADGMGGHQAGEVASELATSTLRERLHDGATSLDVVVAAVMEANAAIFQTAHTNAAQRGMGTTLVAIAVLPATEKRPARFALVNVGDSRCYLVRDGAMVRATVDHSYVQELLATGHINEAEARAHPRRNIVTRALGIEPAVRVDSWLLPVVRGDRFVLCSDGLVDEADDDEIIGVLVANPEPQAAADALVATAVANGGRDNVTVVVVDVLEGAEPGSTVVVDDDSDDEELAAAAALADPIPELDPQLVTAEMPITESRVKRQLTRQLTAGTFLFLLLVAVVVTVIVTLIAVAVTNTNNDEPAPSTTTSSTTSSTSSTSSTTSTSTTSTTVVSSTVESTTGPSSTG